MTNRSLEEILRDQQDRIRRLERRRTGGGGGGGGGGGVGPQGPEGPEGPPGSLWYDSNPDHWDPINVPNPRVNDQFLYPVSGDVFAYQGPNNDWAGWLYIGSIAGPQGPPGNVYWENVEDHGAVGDGSTDDTVAIQAAIDTGRPVYIPAKTFVITAALNLHSGTRIFGDRSSSFGGDTQSQIKQITPGAHALRGTDIIEFQMEDVLLVGPGTGLGDGIWLDRSANPATLYVNLSRVYVQNFGRDGVSLSNAIVSTLDRVVCERNGGHGFNLYGVYQGAAGTSLALNGCFANNNGVTGYNIDSMVYMGLNGCAAEHQPIDYNVIACQGISFTGCGSEQSLGTAWKIHDNSLGIGLYSCWSYRTATNSVLVANNSRAIVISGFVENTPEPSAVNSIVVEATCRATVITGNFISPLSYAAGSTAVLDDGGGAVKTYGDVSGAYFSALYGGDFGGYRVTGVATPVDPTDAANKAYVDAAGGGGGGTLPPRLAADLSGIVAGTDLNTILDTGWYIQTSNTNATTALNYPVASRAGHLEVQGHGSGTAMVLQTYTEYMPAGNGTARKWHRTLYNGTWQGWVLGGITNKGTLSATTLPNAFEYGYTYGDADTSFPTNLAVVEVIRKADTRTVQRVTEKSGWQRTWHRTAVDGATWAPWVLDGGDSDWKPLTAKNAWLFATPAPSYRIRGDIVHLRGEFYAGATQTVVLTLPEEARPASRTAIVVARYATSSVPPVGAFVINTTGDCTFNLISGTIPTASPGFTLLGVSYHLH